MTLDYGLGYALDQGSSTFQTMRARLTISMMPAGHFFKYWLFLLIMSPTPTLLKMSLFVIIGFYTGCPRRNGQNFGRVFLMLNYTDINQNTYIQSWTVTEIMAIEKCGLLECPRTVRRPWRHTRTVRMLGNHTPLASIVMQWPWRDNEQLRPV